MDETACSNESDIQTLCKIFVCVLLLRKEWLMKMGFHETLYDHLAI